MELQFVLDPGGLAMVVVPPEGMCLFAGLFTELREQSFRFSKDFFLLWK